MSFPGFANSYVGDSDANDLYLAWVPWNQFFRSKSTKIMNFRKLKECYVQFASAVQWRPFLGSLWVILAILGHL